LTADMLAAMRAAVPAARHIPRVINTHNNGDHVFGNQLVADSEIIASRACAEEMEERRPEGLAEMLRNWRALGPGGQFFYETMGRKFKFDGIRHTPPTRVFEGRLDLKVGDKDVRLVEVGPAHTRGDVIVWVPQDRTVFTGDIVFMNGHPILWAGPVDNWIAALDLMMSWDVQTVVPGHGPITDRSGLQGLRDYFVYIRDEARKRYDAGMSAEEAAWDIRMDGWSHWLDGERIVVNVHVLYQQFSGGALKPRDEGEVMRLFGLMRKYRCDKCGGVHDPAA
ncbi:MAG: MBL fold metallo-hydrolase, partial [Burkholderiales bacterium]|nr:MBL fold metallo-hydrolase [Burkholderiales bacterium]